MIKYPGYSIESHEVHTEDGYILTLFRIVGQGGKDSAEGPEVVSTEIPQLIVDSTSRQSVLFVHGALGSSVHWCINDPNKTLPYRLAKRGYDCWLANLRGTPLSQKHASLTTKTRKYWDFSFHEMSEFDVPAMINYILGTTGKEKLFYIGHSMGCSIFFAAMSLKPDFCSKVEVMIALSPAVYNTNLTSLVIRATRPFLTFMGKFSHVYRRPYCRHTVVHIAKKVLPRLSNPEKVASWILKKFGKAFGSFGNQISSETFAVIAETWPQSTSMKTMTHGHQCFTANKFQQYDYNRSENLRRYGQETPLLYDLSKIQVPVMCFSSSSDNVCHPDDISRLTKELCNSPAKHFKCGTLTHAEFVLGGNFADEYVYTTVEYILEKYGNSTYL